MTYDVTIMSDVAANFNRVRDRRIAAGLTQAELAARAGISRTAVTAIESARLVPSVAAALALAEALRTTVEELFAPVSSFPAEETWAWPPAASESRWEAEVAGRTVCYPSGSLPMLTPLPDNFAHSSTVPHETLVMASCDPAAGLLASHYTAVTGLRLMILLRSSRQALEMLRQGLVHLAGLHLATSDAPQRNAQTVKEILGNGFDLLRVARWQEGIVAAPSTRLRSIRAAKNARLKWVGREPGSGARQCLDRVLGERLVPKLIARHHRSVAEAVQSGWADAGVCVQLVSAEAGLDFLPVQDEAYDVCYARSMADDRRIKSFLNVVRSPAYRKLLATLPGYDSSETGELRPVD